MTGKWSFVPLDELADKIVDRRGLTPTKLGSAFVHSGHRVISAKLIKDGTIDLGADEPRYVDTETYRRWMRSPLQADDVILTSEAPLGETAYVNEAKEWCLGQRLFGIRTRKERLFGRFLYYALHHKPIRNDLLSRATGTTAQGIRQVELRRVRIPVPPFPEQRAIAHILGTLDDKIELNRKINGTLDEIARTLFTSWFVTFDPVRAKAEGRQPEGVDAETAALFPDRFVDSEFGPIPEGWVVRTLTDLAEINGWNLGQNEALDPIKYIEISEVKKGEIGNVACYERGTEPSRARRRLRHGDTVLSTVRPDRGAYFLCLNPDPNLIASTGFAVLSSRKVPWAFVYLLSTQASVFKHLGLVADGGAYPAVRPNVIGSLQVVMPPTSVIVDRFAQAVEPLLERADLNRAESTTLASIRDTLLPELLSGRIRVPVAEQMIGAV